MWPAELEKCEQSVAVLPVRFFLYSPSVNVLKEGKLYFQGVACFKTHMPL